jgi:hypothetical protein
LCQLTGDSDSTTREPGNASKTTGDAQFDLRNAELNESDRKILGPAESDLGAELVSGLYPDERRKAPYLTQENESDHHSFPFWIP